MGITGSTRGAKDVVRMAHGYASQTTEYAILNKQVKKYHYEKANQSKFLTLYSLLIGVYQTLMVKETIAIKLVSEIWLTFN